VDDFAQPVAMVNNLQHMEKRIENRFDPAELALAQKIKQTRRSRGWSLSDFEEESGGRIKAVVLGSYERCNRAISVRKLALIARVFDLPVSYLLGNEQSTASQRQILMIDIRRVRKSHRDGALEKFFTLVMTKRGDWNGEILTLRYSDLDILSLLNSSENQMTLRYLKENRFILEPTLQR
jgi:transcriptional regulator with XRE-family HTH domain